MGNDIGGSLVRPEAELVEDPLVVAHLEGARHRDIRRRHGLDVGEEVRVVDDRAKLVCVSRCTMTVIDAA